MNPNCYIVWLSTIITVMMVVMVTIVMTMMIDALSTIMIIIYIVNILISRDTVTRVIMIPSL